MRLIAGPDPEKFEREYHSPSCFAQGVAQVKVVCRSITTMVALEPHLTCQPVRVEMCDRAEPAWSLSNKAISMGCVAFMLHSAQQ